MKTTQKDRDDVRVGYMEGGVVRMLVDDVEELMDNAEETNLRLSVQRANIEEYQEEVKKLRAEVTMLKETAHADGCAVTVE